MTDATPMTIGQYCVGISFNPGGNEDVNVIKRKAADLIDTINELSGDPRCKAIAKTEIESAAMWAVKAVTKPDLPEHLKNGTS